MEKQVLSDVPPDWSTEMPRSRGVKRQDVWDAADAVLLQGSKPTIERVRQHLGSGSPNTVGPHLEQWFQHLGSRIKDPEFFAMPHGVPDLVMQAAQHFWETALSQTRLDFDERLQTGLKDAASAVAIEKERAEAAIATAGAAVAKAARLNESLNEMGPLLSRSREELAAQQGRLEEVRGAWALTTERLKEVREEMAKEIADIRAQLLLAMDRADAADRRVALELDRERSARARAERQAEILQKSLAASQTAALAASEHASQAHQALGKREDSLKAALATKVTELNEERERVSDLRVECAAKVLEISEAHAQAKGLQGSLDRLSKLMEVDVKRRAKSERRRVVKGSVLAGSGKKI